MSTAPSLRLYCLRHFHAARPVPGQRDFDRPLDARGRAQAGPVAERMRSAGVRFSTIFVSPSLRTLQTAAAIDIPDDDDRIVRTPSLYEAPAEAYDDLLRRGVPGDSVMIGHNPGMEEFVFALCGNAADDSLLQARGFSTGGLACISLPQGAVSPGSGRLEWFFLPPRP